MIDVQSAYVNGLVIVAFIAWVTFSYIRDRRADFRDNHEAIMKADPNRLDDLLEDEGFLSWLFLPRHGLFVPRLAWGMMIILMIMLVITEL